jgi:hypothetical protein
VLAGVEAVVGPLGSGPPGGSGGAGDLAPASIVADVSAPRRVLPLVASFVLGGAAGAIAVLGVRPTPAERIVYIDRTAPSPPAHAPAEGSPVAPEVSSDPPVAARRIAPLPAPASAEGGSTLAAERRLLDVARRAVTEEDGAAALAAVAEHERRFPAGLLVQEREAMAVRALVLLGRSEEARARAGRFRGRFPNSLLLPAVEAAARSAPAQ